MNRITDFVDSFIPKNLPKARKTALKEELQNHILDKTDFYKEIGFSEEKSIEKAINDFGTDEDMKKHIYSEFEELYGEKSIWGILSFILIWIMNWSCLQLDIWVTSADFNKDPEPFGAFISFLMVGTVIGLTVFARVKKYRKMLVGIGLANLTIGGLVLADFYPQMAFYTLEYDLIYLIDRFTPISLFDGIIAATNGYLAAGGTFVFPLAVSLYSFVTAYKAGKGRAKTVKKPLKKAIVFCCVYLTLASVLSLMVTTAENYVDDYPLWLDYYRIHISEEARDIYSGVNIGDSTDEAESYLHSKGYKSIEEYRETLTLHQKKQFNTNLKHFDFIDGYTIYFNPDEYIAGNGIIGIKEENGNVTGVGVGNLNKEMCYDEPTYKNNYGVGIYNIDDDDTDEVIAFFNDLEKGDSILDVMEKFGNEYGVIYTERVSIEDGTPKHYYRVYCRNDSEPENKSYYFVYEYLYIELSFTDLKFDRGVLHSKKHYSDGTDSENMYVR